MVNEIKFIDAHKFKTIKELNDKCRLHQWSINYNKQHVVNGFNTLFILLFIRPLKCSCSSVPA